MTLEFSQQLTSVLLLIQGVINIDLRILNSSITHLLLVIQGVINMDLCAVNSSITHVLLIIQLIRMQEYKLLELSPYRHLRTVSPPIILTWQKTTPLATIIFIPDTSYRVLIHKGDSGEAKTSHPLGNSMQHAVSRI